MAQSKCPDPAISGSAHSRGPTPVDFFCPHSTVHPPGFPTRPPTTRNHSGAAHLHSLRTHSTHKFSGLQHPDPYTFGSERSGARPWSSTILLAIIFSPLQPLALSTLKPRRLGASLGWTAQHAHTGLSYHTTHRNKPEQDGKTERKA